MVLLVENDANDVPQIHRVASPSTAAIVDCRTVRDDRGITDSDGRECGQDAAVGAVEAELATGVADDRPAILVNPSVMETAQQHQIVDIGVSALEPMDEVVRVEPPSMRAARHPTTAITQQERTLQPAPGDA